MIDLINQLIAINLQLFHTAEHNQLKLKDFRDCEGRQISGAKLLADIMLNKELIQPSATEKNTYQLTEFGNNICLFGGWEKHLENENKLQAVLEKETAEKFLSLVPQHDMIKFAKNGSIVTTAAVKLARAFTGRKLVAIPGDHPFYSYDDWFIGKTACDLGVPDEISNLSVTFKSNDLKSK